MILKKKNLNRNIQMQSLKMDCIIKRDPLDQKAHLVQIAVSHQMPQEANMTIRYLIVASCCHSLAPDILI